VFGNQPDIRVPTEGPTYQGFYNDNYVPFIVNEIHQVYKMKEPSGWEPATLSDLDA